MREDAGGRLVALLRSEVFCANPLEPHGHELKHAVVKGSAVVAVELVIAVAEELELELIQSHMAQKPVLRGEVGCACVAREVSVERGVQGAW